MDLKNKVALVTGAAQGIGYAIAERYVAAGARVAIADIREDAAAAAAKTLKGEAMGVAMDVTDEAAVNAGVAKVAKAWGGIMVPAATPQPVIERLARAIERVMTAPDIDERFVQINNEIDYKPTAEFAAYLREQKEKFAGIIRRANIRIEQ